MPQSLGCPSSHSQSPIFPHRCCEPRHPEWLCSELWSGGAQLAPTPHSSSGLPSTEGESKSQSAEGPGGKGRDACEHTHIHTFVHSTHMFIHRCLHIFTHHRYIYTHALIYSLIHTHIHTQTLIPNLHTALWSQFGIVSQL